MINIETVLSGYCATVFLGLYHPEETMFGVEKADGSNCATAGDHVCDTPKSGVDNLMSMKASQHIKFTAGQGYRIRREMLQAVRSCTCASISYIDVICLSQSTTVNLSNTSGQTAVWSSSSNVKIVSSNDTSANIQNTGAAGNGWIKARLSNNIILKENFWIGKPTNNLRVTTTGNGDNLFANTWQELFALGGGFNDEVEWKVSSSSVSIQKTGSSSILVYPKSNAPSSVKISYRPKNKCGTSSNWLYKYFTVKTASGGTSVAH